MSPLSPSSSGECIPHLAKPPKPPPLDPTRPISGKRRMHTKLKSALSQDGNSGEYRFPSRCSHLRLRCPAFKYNHNNVTQYIKRGQSIFLPALVWKKNMIVATFIFVSLCGTNDISLK